jgi:uncharacterized repeat protein (TIGR01451 family)
LKQANFDPARRFVFRYALFGHQNNARRAVNDCTSGWAEGIPANDFMVTLGGRRDLNGDGTVDTACWGSGNANTIDEDGDGTADEDPPNGVDDDGDCTADTNGDGLLCNRGDVGVDEDGGFSVGSRGQQAGTFMHELGHTIGLRHGGGDDTNDKPNFLSVMNYAFTHCTVPPQPGILPGGCDFSRDELDPLTEFLPPGLNECVGINGIYGFGPVNWDGDVVRFEGVSNCVPPNNTNVSADINGDGALTVLTGFDDWDNIRFDFRLQDNFADGVAEPVRDEPDPEIVERAQRRLAQLMQPILTIEKTASSDSVSIGETLVYTVKVKNMGNGPAFNVIVTDTLPDGSTKDFELETMPAGSEEVFEVEFFVDADSQVCGILHNQAKAQYKDIVGNMLTAIASVETPIVPKFEYVAKMVCGKQPDPKEMKLARGFYTTSVNIHNHNCADVTLFKKLALTYPPGGQTPGKVLPIAIDRLKPDQALAVDCTDIKKRLFPKGFPTPYIEGFLVVQSPESLDVSAVYSTASLDKDNQAGDHSSIHIQRIPERIVEQGKGADLSIKKEVKIEPVTTPYHTTHASINLQVIMRYKLSVTNLGPSTATNIVVRDELAMDQGEIAELPESGTTTSHGGQWFIDNVDRFSAGLRAEILSLPAGETATLEFPVVIVLHPPGQNNQLWGRVVNTAVVSSALEDPEPSNNSVTVQTDMP